MCARSTPGDAQDGNSDAAARLDTLATALFERPGLRLSIAGAADEPIDAPGLRRARLEALVAEADAALAPFGAKADTLRAAARFIAERKM